MTEGRRWTVTDASGNSIYLTEERWEHICHGHPEMVTREGVLLETIRKGRRRQDPLNPQKYYYRLPVPNLPWPSTHIEVVVLFRFGVSNDEGVVSANNYVLTGNPKLLRRET